MKLNLEDMVKKYPKVIAYHEVAKDILILLVKRYCVHDTYPYGRAKGSGNCATTLLNIANLKTKGYPDFSMINGMLSNLMPKPDKQHRLVFTSELKAIKRFNEMRKIADESNVEFNIIQRNESNLY